MVLQLQDPVNLNNKAKRPEFIAHTDIMSGFLFPLSRNGTRLLFVYSPLCEGKSVSLQTWSGPDGSRNLRFPDFMTTAQEGGKVLSLTHRPHLSPENPPSIHFCYWLSRLQCHSAIGRFMSMKNSNDTIWNRISDLPICSTAP